MLVTVDDLKANQVTARAVINDNGAVLCPAGFQLTEAAIMRMKNAGIVSVAIEGGGEEHQARYAERLQEMERRFRGVDDQVMLEIREILDHRLRTMSNESGGGTH